MNRLSVAIDGPAGVGKSTIAKIIADKLDLMYINTGAMYRAVTLKALEADIDYKNVAKLLELINSMDIYFENDELFLNGENINDKITMPEISKRVSEYASVREVRVKLVELMRAMSNKYNVIMDGRDIGTVVLKEAPYKFFLVASAYERANRRYKELVKKGLKVDYNEILEDIIKRDEYDSTREVDPLRKADDAIEVDTTYLTIEGVVSEILKNIK
ncbi:MAG: (d)CMP kinase [Sarcina sp.]